MLLAVTMTMTVVVVVAAAASVMTVFKTALWPSHHAFRATLVLTPSYRKAVMAAGEAAPPPLTLRPLCPDSMFTTRGPEQVVSHTHFTLTLLHVMVVRHIV